MTKDWSKAAWNDAEQTAYDHGYIDGKIAGAEDLLAEKDERIADLEYINDECESALYRLQDRIEQLEALCRDIYKALDNVAANLETLVGQPMRILTEESAAKTRRDLDCYKERMDALGLLELDE